MFRSGWASLQICAAMAAGAGRRRERSRNSTKADKCRSLVGSNTRRPLRSFRACWLLTWQALAGSPVLNVEKYRP